MNIFNFFFIFKKILFFIAKKIKTWKTLLDLFKIIKINFIELYLEKKYYQSKKKENFINYEK
jgi:hypothetical protein